VRRGQGRHFKDVFSTRSSVLAIALTLGLGAPVSAQAAEFHSTEGNSFMYVSSRHAEVRRGPRGFEVADAFSSNGVWVDGKRLPRGGVVPIANGALVRAGRTLLLFRTN
jgi:hypothetical protein